MSKADDSYQRACDRVRREVCATAPKVPRFSKSGVTQQIARRMAHSRYDDVDSRPEHAWASAGAREACQALLNDIAVGRVTKRGLRALCVARAAQLKMEHRLQSGNGTAQTWGKGEVVARAYGAYREYLDLAEWMF